MALNLTIDNIVQSNDAVTLQINDTAGIYDASINTGGWGTPNPDVTQINGTTLHLYLDISVATSNGTETVYDQIELFDNFGPFTTINDLSFNITPDLLISGSTAMGTSDEELVDGWYSITYSFIDDTLTFTDSTVTEELLVKGKVQKKVTQGLKDIPYSTSWVLFNHDYKEWYDIIYPMYYKGLLDGIVAEESIARKSIILDMLATLERLLNNG